MEKMENLEQLGNIQEDIATAANLQRFLQQQTLTTEQLFEKSHSWFFESLKRELANRLSILEAYFVSDCNLHDFNRCQESLQFLNDISCEVDEFLVSLRFHQVHQEEREVPNAKKKKKK